MHTRLHASRWARLLRSLGHTVKISEEYNNENVDCLVALHAYRSASSVDKFRLLHPKRPLVVGLAGTDIYKFQVGARHGMSDVHE